MIIGATRLNSADYKQLATLHSINLGNSILSKLGSVMLQRYYKFIEQSQSNFLFIEGVSGEIRGATVLSFDSRTVMHEFVKNNFMAFALSAAWKCLTTPSFILILFQQSSPDSSSLDNDAKQQIEIVQIFVDEKYRNQKIGKKLLDKVNDFLYSRNISKYIIRTRVNNNEATLGFYEKNNFIEIKRAKWKDDFFVFMEKSVHASAMN